MHAIKKCLMLLWGVAFAAALQAQAPAPDAPLQYTPEQLDELLAPIALYPDPLIALILPAASAPSDLAQAGQFLAANGNDPSQIAAQPWDPSVQGLAHYPTVIAWMNDNPDWTEAVGLAFTQQPAQVMESIQQLRAQALAAGTLVNSPEQQVVMVGSTICIFPTDPNVIYVPQYDPDGIYETPTVADNASLIVYSPGYAVGPWLNYECDWDDYGVWIGVWQPGWAYRRDWRPAPGRTEAVGAGFFRPDSRNRTALVRNFSPASRSTVPRPRTAAGAPRAGPGAQPFRSAVTAAPTRANPRGYPATTPVAQIPVRSGAAVTPVSPITVSPARPTPVEQNRPAAVANNPAPAAGNRSPVEENRPANVAENKPSPIAENRPAPGVSTRTPTPVEVTPIRTAAPVSAPAPQGALFGSYNRGTDAVNNSNRGQASRQAAGPPASAPPARPAPAAPAPRAAPPAPRAEPAAAPLAAPAPAAPAGPAPGATTGRGR